MAASSAVGCTVFSVPVLGAAPRAWHPVSAGGADGRILASVPVAGTPELPADLDTAGV